MTNIYTLAHRVVAWLGEESNDSKHVLETLQYVGRQLEATKSGRIIAAPDATELTCGGMTMRRPLMSGPGTLYSILWNAHGFIGSGAGKRSS
jgi:hypothetical protein